MSRWRLSGYAEPGLFPGAPRCRFRLCHVRDDGLVAMTVGDQREGGGKLAPVHGGFHFATFVGRPGEAGHVAAYSTHEEAAQGHQHHLDAWEDDF